MLVGKRMGLFRLKKHPVVHRNHVMMRDGVLHVGDHQVEPEDPCERLAQRCSYFFSVLWDCVVCNDEPEEEFSLNMLSARQLRQLRWAFNVLDEDKSGYIQGKELEQVVQLLGDNPSRSEAEDLLNWIDKNHDGQVSFEEFARAWWRRPSGTDEIQQKQEELEMAFRLFDANSVSQSHRPPRLVASLAAHATPDRAFFLASPRHAPHSSPSPPSPALPRRTRS